MHDGAAGTPLCDRECVLIGWLVRGLTWEQACDAGEVAMTYYARNQALSRILRKLRLEDVTQVRLWASPVSDAELRRLCGKCQPEPQVRVATA